MSAKVNDPRNADNTQD